MLSTGVDQVAGSGFLFGEDPSLTGKGFIKRNFACY
jgi:hypothetical protein